jgi:hypothetical protein
MDSPQFEYDIFISYAHLDNDPTIKGKPGWVDFFEDVLRKRLSVRMGKEVVIFRDPQLRNFGTFSAQLTEALKKTAVLISVLSPRYVDSKWCLRELSDFFGSAGSGRIIKIAKTVYGKDTIKLEAQELLKQMKDVLEIRFYKEDESSLLYTDLQPEIIESHIPECLDLIDDLAQNIKMLLKDMQRTNTGQLSSPAATAPVAEPASQTAQSPAASSIPAASSPAGEEAAEEDEVAVYLAETTKDRAEDRNKIKSELAQYNYRILPDQPLPQDAEELAAAVRSYLEKSKLSVHLIGANYGVRPEGEERSIPHIQYDIAAAMNKEGGLEQLVWMPNDLTPKEKSQEEFVQHVRDNSPEYQQNKLEDLKTEVLKKLRPGSPDPWEVDEGAPINVCLYCHEQDFNSVAPLYSHLTINETFNVKLPLKEANSIEEQKEILQGSDAVLLYYGAVDKESFVNILKWVNKHSADGRKIRAIYAGVPATTDKELLVSNDPIILKNFGEFNSTVIAPFVQQIKAAKGGA